MPHLLTRRRAFAPQISSAQPQNLRPTFPATLQLVTGLTENRVLGRTEGNPHGIIVNHGLNTGGSVFHASDHNSLVAALAASAATTTNNIIVLDNSFTVNPVLRLPFRANENLRCDIVSAAVFAGTFPRGVNERVHPLDAGIVTLTRALTANSPGTLGGSAMMDTGAAAGAYSNLASGYRFIGIEFRTHPSQLHIQFQMIDMGSILGPQNAISKIPQNIIFDRCILNGGEFCENKFGLMFAVRRSAVRNCYIYNFWSRNLHWDDTAGICSWNTDGGNLIENNYIDSSGENWFIGGGNQNCGANNEDWVFRRNHFRKNYALYHGKSFDDVTGAALDDSLKCVIKNLGETKQCNRVVIEDNIFEQSFQEATAGQGSTAHTHKLTDYGSPGHDPKSGNQLFRGNLTRKAGILLSLIGNQDGNTGNGREPGMYQREMHYLDNVFEDYCTPPFVPPTGNAPRLILLGADATYPHGALSWDHNTVVTEVANPNASGTIFTVGTNQANSVERLDIVRSILHWGQYGITAQGSGGQAALNATCTEWHFDDNLILKAAGTQSAATHPAGSPANTYVPQLSDLYEAADIVAKVWRLKASLGAARIASDGWQKGVSDWDHFAGRLVGVASP